jgi:hypothetical protein
LSLTTGLVSASYNTKYNNNVDTVLSAFDNYLPRSQWQVKRGFRVDPNIPTLRIPPDKSTTSTHDNAPQSTNDHNTQVSDGESFDTPSQENHNASSSTAASNTSDQP